MAENKKHNDSEKLLYETLFYSDYYDANKIDTKSLPEDIQERVREYVAKFNKHKKTFKHSPGAPVSESTMIKGAVSRKKNNIEKGIVFLINKKGIKKEAIFYADEAVVYYEWEGFSDPPLGEAEHALEFLKDNPDTPIKPYLIIFIIQRYKHALNAIEYEKKVYKDKPNLLTKHSKLYDNTLKTYKRYLKIAAGHPDPLIRWFATYIDTAESLY